MCSILISSLSRPELSVCIRPRRRAFPSVGWDSPNSSRPHRSVQSEQALYDNSDKSPVPVCIDRCVEYMLSA